MTAVVACLLVISPPAFARDAGTSAPRDAAAGRPLSADESATLSRALAFDPSRPAASTKSLRRPAPKKTRKLAVSRSDKPDGSSAVTVKQPLAEEVGTADMRADVGADFSLAAPPAMVYRPGAPLPGAASGDTGAGAAWASVGMAHFATVDARVDPTDDHGRLAGTLKHSLPVGKKLSVTLEDRYSLSDTLSASPDTATAPSATAAPTQVWGNSKSVKLAVKPTGTTFGAGISSASNDPVTHNRLSAQQKLFGPLHVTTAVTDLGEPSENKSISAGFKLNW
ncbi:MAG: hypothetical protein P8Y71_06620 [Pseudolabrys sp.]